MNHKQANNIIYIQINNLCRKKETKTNHTLVLLEQELIIKWAPVLQP